MDEFETHQNSLSAPALFAEPVSPSDSTSLALATRAIYVGGAGDLRARMASGGDVTFRNLQAGAVYPFRLEQVFATGTTATNLIGLR